MRGLPTVDCSVSVAQQGTGQNGATRGTESGKGGAKGEESGTSGKGGCEGEILMRKRGNTGEGEGEGRSCRDKIEAYFFLLLCTSY